MLKADLHVHSMYSEHPSEWFLQRLGAKESYIDPEFVYKTAKERGMDFVTLTDHNKIDGALILKKKYPDDFIMGVEATTYFPENNCKVHILIYDFTEDQFNEIQRLRSNIYDLRDFLKTEKLPHSVAHASYSVNGKLNLELFEKLILLFDVFESINGGRNEYGNNIVYETLRNLNPQIISGLFNKYGIIPFSDTPWIKGFTGGSDDHAGFFIGKTFTISESYNKEDFVKTLVDKQTLAGGRHNNYQGLAFSIYKIAYDFSKTKSEKLPKGLMSGINGFIFENKSFSFINKLKLNKLRSSKGKDKNKMKGLLVDLIDELKIQNNFEIEEKLDLIYDKIADISDEFLKSLVTSLEHDFKKGNLLDIINKITSTIPGLFLAFPFISTLKHMFQDRTLLDSIIEKYVPEKANEDKKILWFSDTITDLNGVSVTLRKIGFYSLEKGKNIKIVSSVSKKQVKTNLPPSFINLPYFSEFKLPNYENLILKLPSVLKALKIIYENNPDEIYISSPGPIGLLGVLAAKLLNIKCIGVYHTDFAIQAYEITKEESVFNIVDSYAKWFYSVCDHVKVPTKEYIEILNERNYNNKEMSIFGRGIDSGLFNEVENAKENLSKEYGIKKGITLLYSGRISKDKNLEFLVEVYKKVVKKYEKINLLFVGNGPYLQELKSITKKIERIYFTGELGTEKMPEIYSGCDILVFPSITDTFGMSVLEAQTCGTPAIVSDIGGPKEIIIDGVTGFVCKSNDISDWEIKINNFIDMIINNPKAFNIYKTESRKNAVKKYDWDKFIDGIVSRKQKAKKIEITESVQTVA